MATTLSPELLAKLDALDDLPSLPDVLVRLLELCESEGVEVRPIARLIESDAGLAARVMGVVGSSGYGMGTKIAGVEQAVVYLGTEAVKSIAICACLAEAFSRLRGGGTSAALELRRIWRHSLLCALLARALARSEAYLNPDEVFLAGLVHDLGKHVLLALFPAEYPQSLARSRANPDLLLVEEVRIGAAHPDVGAWLVRRWHLPEAVAEAVEYHHEPFHRVLDSSLLLRFVYAANYLTSAASEREQFPNERVATLLGMRAEAVAEAARKAAHELDETARSLGVSLDGTEEKPAPDGKSERLERETRNVSMLLASLWSLTRAPDEAGILSTVFRALAALFRVDAALYFSYLPAPDTLRCSGGSGRLARESIHGLAVNRALSKSLVAEASRAGEMRYSTGQPAPIIDGQIRRILGTAGFACCPLSVRGEAVGVLVIGAEDGAGETLRRREKPLLLLAAEAAFALHADRLRERELERVRIERIAAAQLVVDRVVHEVRSPLAAIKNALGALTGTSSSPEADAILGSVSDEVDRLGRLLAGLARISSAERPVLEELDLSALVDGYRPLLGRIAPGSSVTVTVSSDPTLPRVRGSPDGIRQIMVNLVRNAVEAMPEGGAVTVRTERDPADSAKAVLLIVEDTGTGVPDRVRGRLFEPFVTTKGEGHRGLGLSIVHALARQQGGDVSCEAAGPGGGARFVVRLPTT